MSEGDPLWLYARIWTLREGITEAAAAGDRATIEELTAEYHLRIEQIGSTDLAGRVSDVQHEMGRPITDDPIILLRAMMIGPSGGTDEPDAEWKRVLAQAKKTAGRRLVLVVCGERCGKQLGEVVHTAVGPLFRSVSRSHELWRTVLGPLKPSGVHLPYPTIERWSLLRGVPEGVLIDSLIVHCDDHGEYRACVEELLAKVDDCKHAGGKPTVLAVRRAVR